MNWFSSNALSHAEDVAQLVDLACRLNAWDRINQMWQDTVWRPKTQEEGTGKAEIQGHLLLYNKLEIDTILGNVRPCLKERKTNSL